MLGVVLWSDRTAGSAVIWCEDHGDLAYFGSSSHPVGSPVDFGEGDLIQFDLAIHETMRLARNPRRIAQQYCSDLSEVVTAASMMKSEIEASRDSTAQDVSTCSRQSARPICLDTARERRQSNKGVAA